MDTAWAGCTGEGVQSRPNSSHCMFVDNCQKAVFSYHKFQLK